MGWDFQHVAPGTKTADVMLPLFTDWEVLDHAQVGKTFYAVGRHNTSGEVVAFVTITQRRSNDYFNFGKKDMSWDMGPTEATCPDRLLDLLPEAPCEYAEKWVAQCRAYNQRVKTNRSVKPGQTVRLTQALRFTDGIERDTFTYEGKSDFRSSDGVRVRITRWRGRPFTLVA
jgi:hypothetical protein